MWYSKNNVSVIPGLRVLNSGSRPLNYTYKFWIKNYLKGLSYEIDFENVDEN
jgi:hypothetical protein